MSWNFDQTRNHRRTFRVVTDDDKDDGLVVTSAAGIPSLGVPYLTANSSDPLAVVEGYDTAQDEKDPRLWKVTVRYSVLANLGGLPGGGGGTPGSGGGGPDNRPTNPLAEPTRWSMDFQKATKAIWEDKDGKDLKNAAGDWFSPPVEVPRMLAIIVATKNYASMPYSTAAAYFNKVNDAAWNGFATKSVKVDGIRIEEDWRAGVSFVRVTWHFLWDPELWIPFKVLNAGPRKLVAGVLRPASTEGQSVLLTADGTNTTDVPNYIDFRLHDAVSFAGIP